MVKLRKKMINKVSLLYLESLHWRQLKAEAITRARLVWTNTSNRAARAVLSGPAAAQQGTVSSEILPPPPPYQCGLGAHSVCGTPKGGLVAFLAQRPMLLVHFG